MKRVVLVLTLSLVLASVLTAQVRFEGLDLNGSSELLFSARATAPGFGESRTLFLADIPAARMTQLTLFPERLTVLGTTGQIQVQNRFGVFRTTDDVTADLLAARDAGGDGSPGAGGSSDPDGADAASDASAVVSSAPRPTPRFAPVRPFPAFVEGNDVQTGKTIAVGSSPDGRYLTYLVADSAGYGTIRLLDTRSGRETTVSTRVELTLDGAPLRWSGDSSFFVYSKGNELFYYSMQQFSSGRALTERLRRIGPGTIESVRWVGDNTLYYVTGTTVYRILGVEFFARSLYQDLLKIGTIIGKLPYAYDPNFDRFWISPTGDAILVSKDGRSVNVLFLQADDYVSTGETLSLPYLYLPRNTRVREVLWSDEQVITLMTGSIRFGEQSTAVYRLDLLDAETRSRFELTSDEDVLGIALAPDGREAIVWTADGVSIRDYGSWEEERSFEHAGLLHAAWVGTGTLVLAGDHIIERVRLRDGSRDLLALSQAERYGFNADTAVVYAEANETVYELAAEGWVATEADALEVADAGVASEDYRVYLENLSRGSYANMVMVRNVDTFGTVPLFPRPQRQYDPFPDSDDRIDLTNFSHGSRIRRREVSLVFNAIDSVAGLTEILNTLSEYDVQATFFLNGDFIRRHPGAVREIADSGHEVGNLFFTYFDMGGGQFQITADFIQQGLARNEDEYFEVTGEELSLLWHAPYYFVSPLLLSAARQMNYAYIGRDVDSLDWVAKRDEGGVSRLYKPTAEIIEDVMAQKQPGSIIAMTVGRPGDDSPEGGRDDYLFHRLDVLLNGLIERGYGIVPVSTLMDNAR